MMVMSPTGRETALHSHVKIETWFFQDGSEYRVTVSPENSPCGHVLGPCIELFKETLRRIPCGAAELAKLLVEEAKQNGFKP